MTSPLELQTGTPPVDGRYVVWTPCAALQAREWCEPSIATWHGGKWHFYEPVWAWVGPLPVVHGNDCLKKLEKPVFVGFDPASPGGDMSARVTVQDGKVINVEYDL